jgi:hypothetical protein
MHVVVNLSFGKAGDDFNAEAVMPSNRQENSVTLVMLP